MDSDQEVVHKELSLSILQVIHALAVRDMDRSQLKAFLNTEKVGKKLCALVCLHPKPGTLNPTP